MTKRQENGENLPLEARQTSSFSDEGLDAIVRFLARRAAEIDHSHCLQEEAARMKSETRQIE